MDQGKIRAEAMTPLSTNRIQRQTLKRTWQDYLFQLPEIIGGRYEYVGHFTYRDAEEIPPRHAEDVVRKRFAYFVGEVNKVDYGKRWMRKGKGTWGAMAIEKHLSGYPHHHAIICGDGLREGIKRVEMMNIWSVVEAERSGATDSYMATGGHGHDMRTRTQSRVAMWS